MDIYREEILDHFRNPRNFGEVDKADIRAEERNASCGDRLEMSLKIKNGRVVEVKFQGEGCAISLAAASMLTEMVKGRSWQEVKKIKDKDMFERLGIKISQARIKCATLGVASLQKGLKKYEAEK